MPRQGWVRDGDRRLCRQLLDRCQSRCEPSTTEYGRLRHVSWELRRRGYLVWEIGVLLDTAEVDVADLLAATPIVAYGDHHEIGEPEFNGAHGEMVADMLRGLR